MTETEISNEIYSLSKEYDLAELSKNSELMLPLAEPLSKQHYAQYVSMTFLIQKKEKS